MLKDVMCISEGTNLLSCPMQDGARHSMNGIRMEPLGWFYQIVWPILEADEQSRVYERSRAEPRRLELRGMIGRKHTSLSNILRIRIIRVLKIILTDAKSRPGHAIRYTAQPGNLWLVNSKMRASRPI